MTRMRRKGLSASVLAIAAVVATAGAAQGAVTIGSSLATTANGNDPGCAVAGVPCTATNLSLPSPSLAPGGLFSPVNGTVTSWRLGAMNADTISLQVVRPVSGTTYAGVSTSAPVSYMLNMGDPFPNNQTSLPVKIGDGLGLLDPNANFIYANTTGGQVAAWYLAPGGPLGNGQTRTADIVGNNKEALVQATIEPTNTLTFGPLARNKKKGTATVSLTAPNPGQLIYAGQGVSVTGPASVAAPGDVQLTVRATGKKAKKLKRKGKVSISFGTTFTPSFGAAGITPDNLTLRKKLKKK
jgi:hypothetical protein